MRLQEPQTPQPPAPPPTINPSDLGARIEDAIQGALSGTQSRDAARQSVREAMEQVRAEIEAARAQGVERITIQPQFDPNVIPPGAVDISIAFFLSMAFIIVGLPIARAFARRMDRRGESPSAGDLSPRLDRIEQAIEAVAIEVERVSEGQRYTTRAIAELRGLPASHAGAGWPTGSREPEHVPASESTRRP